MDFRSIIEKSYNNVLKFRYLWGLGIVAMLTSSFGSYQGGGGSSPSDKDIDWNSAVTWFRLHQSLIILLAIIFLALAIVIIYFSLRAQAAQISAVKKIEDGEPYKTFSDAYRSSEGYALSFFLLGLLYFFLFLTWVLLTIFLPIILMAIVPVIFIFIFGGLLLAVGLLITILLAIAIPVSLSYSQRLVVLKNKKIIDAFEGGVRLFRHNLANSILGILIQLLIGIVIGIGFAIVIAISFGLLFLIGWAIYAALGIIGSVIYGVILGLPFLAICLLLGGILNSFYSSYWTLIFLKLKK